MAELLALLRKKAEKNISSARVFPKNATKKQSQARLAHTDADVPKVPCDHWNTAGIVQWL